MFVFIMEEGGDIFVCVCFKDFENGEVDRREGGWFFLFYFIFISNKQ